LISLEAKRIAQSSIIVDTHIDVPYRVYSKPQDISESTDSGDFDYPRAIRGGLNAPFMSIFTTADLEASGGSKERADTLIDLVDGFVEQWPEKFAIATSPADVREHFKKGIMSLPLGMENGSPIEGDLANLQHFYDRGIRYVTLAHSLSNHISDSSYDTNRQWNGLSVFGAEVVKEMNPLGIMVDISHVSDDAFWQAIKLSEAPIIASHSSARHFNPGFERTRVDTYRVFPDVYEQQHGELPYANVDDVLDHIDRVVSLTSIEHVGIGSDFDGVGDSLPFGLKDVSAYPNLIEGLLKRGYSEADIRKILGENLLRVWQAVEDHAATTSNNT
jgi:membrane dipeptidase